MDNDVLQDNNGNIVNPDNNEVLDNEVEGGISSGTVSPGTGPGTGDFEQDKPGGGFMPEPNPDPPTIPDPGTDPDEPDPEEPGSGSGSVPVLTPEQKIPTNLELQLAIRKIAGKKTDLTDYYDWTGATYPQTEDYCPTRGQIQDNIQDKMKVQYVLPASLSLNLCPPFGELLGENGAIKIDGTTPIPLPEDIPEV